MDLKLRERIICSTEAAIKYFTALPGNPKPERKGGVVTYYSVEEGIEHMKVGEISDMVSAERYFSFSREKILRLKAHPEHISSFQSRDIEKEMYAGAIRAIRCILSLSGLPELGDEAVMLVVALDLDLIKYDEAVKIAAISKNQFFQPLYGKMMYA